MTFPYAPTFAPFNIKDAQGKEVINPTWLRWFHDISNMATQVISSGIAGPPGSSGGIGLQGVPGLVGSQGYAGDAGQDGEDGLPGPSGVMGPQGPTGFGIDGLDGADGDPVPGPIGPIGPIGPVGMQGFGADGSDGEDGFQGLPGPAGSIGPSGNSFYSLQDDPLDIASESMMWLGDMPQTFYDGSTWGSNGISNTASYTTASTTAPVNFTHTNNYASTAGGVSGINLSPTLVSTGASAGNLSMLIVSPVVGSSANNIGSVRGVFLTPSTAAGYTGTVTSFNCLEINPTISGTHNATTLNRIQIDTNTSNGSGITSGTITNNGILISGDAVAAGVGGVVVNNGVNINLSSGSAAGNVNSGLYIQGAGGAASTNYAIQSVSTAPSLFSGPITSTVPDNVAASIPTVASGTTIAITTPYAFVSGTATIETITAPAGATNGCQITIIPTGLFLTGLTGNIALASTAVVSKALIMTYAASTSKWYPSY